MTRRLEQRILEAEKDDAGGVGQFLNLSMGSAGSGRRGLERLEEEKLDKR